MNTKRSNDLWRWWRRRHSDERLVSVLHICRLVAARDSEESSELAGVGGAEERWEDESHGIWKQNPPNRGQWRLPAVFTRNSLRIWRFRTMSDKKWGRGVLPSHLRVLWDLSAERDPAWEVVAPGGHSFSHHPAPGDSLKLWAAKARPLTSFVGKEELGRAKKDFSLSHLTFLHTVNEKGLEQKLTKLDSLLKSRDITLPTKVCIVKAIVFPVVMYTCESWTIKKAEHWRIDAFELWCWRRLLRVPWTARRSNHSILKEINPEYSLGRIEAEAEAPILWPPGAKSPLTGKDPDAGKDWGQEEKQGTEDEMVGWHHWLNGHEYE